MHVTKFYFIQLVHKIKYVEFEDRPTIFYNNLLECENVSVSDRRMSYQKLENTNIGRRFAKVAKNRFDRTHCDDKVQNVLFIHRFIFTR